MRNKKHVFFTLPLLVSAVSLGAMNVAMSAQYEAKTKWSVQKEKQAGYCAASQGFSHKAYVTFAKRNDGALSLAIDFQKDTFSTAKKQTFRIKSGSVSRSFQVMPNTQNAIVLPLGDDTPLIDALIETSMLTLKIGDETHDFALRSPQDLKRDLHECVADIMPKGPVMSSENLVQKNMGSNEVDALRAENRRLEQLLKDVRRAADEKVSSMTSSARSEEAKEKVFVLEQENARLQSELKSLSNLKNNLTSVEAIKADLSLVNIAKDALQTQLAEANTKILTLEAERQSYSEVTQNADQSAIDELEAVKAEKILLEEKLLAHQGTLEEKDAKLSELQQKLVLENQTTTDLKSALELNRKEIERLQIVSNEAEGGTVEMKTLQENLLLDIKSKDLEITEKTDAIRALSSEKEGLVAQVTSLEAQVRTLMDSQSSQEVEDVSLIEQLQADIAGKSDQIKSLTEENATQVSMIAELKSAAEEVTNLSEAVPVAPVVAELDAGMLDQLKADIVSKETQISELEAEILKLKGDVTNNIADAKLLTAQQEEYRFLERRYKTALVDLEAIKTQNIDLEDQLQLLENKLVEVKTENKNIALAPDASWDLEKATRRYQEAQREIISLGRMVEQKDQQCDFEKKDIEKLLFDPEIATTEQRTKLAMLESELQEKNQLIADLEAVKAQPQPEPRPYVEKIEISEPAPVIEKQIPQVSQPVKMVEKVEQAVVAAPASSVSPVISSPPVVPVVRDSYMKTLIKRVGLGGSVEEQQQDNMTVLRWKKNGLHATAVEKPMVNSNLSQAVNAYIDRAQSKCSGDFAAIPSLQTDAKQTYEIACVKPGGKGSSASLLFLKEQGSMITIAHEGRTDLMEQAIEARDIISQAAQN